MKNLNYLKDRLSEETIHLLNQARNQQFNEYKKAEQKAWKDAIEFLLHCPISQLHVIITKNKLVAVEHNGICYKPRFEQGGIVLDGRYGTITLKQLFSQHTKKYELPNIYMIP